MMRVTLFTLFLFFSVTLFSQEWVIIDVLEQSKKELVYRIDNGEKVIKKTVKNPSIVHLINDYQKKGFQLKNVTQGIELDLNGTFPLRNNMTNNFGVTNLTLFNNNRVMLWFEKKK